MPIVLALNPGSNSLKFDIADVGKDQPSASFSKKLLSGNLDNIGKEKGSRMDLMRDGKTIASEEAAFHGFPDATAHLLKTFRDGKIWDAPKLTDIELFAVRVVHGGTSFSSAVAFNEDVRKEIEAKEELAPLHNAMSLQIIDAILEEHSSQPIFVTFDTAFHRTIPEHAWRYAIAREVTDRFGIRKFGFHGLSHRYMLEQYARLTARPTEKISAVTFHLESGSSAAAIRNGQSIDTSMGFTPLEGLMMGTRSGSADLAIVPFLLQHAGMNIAEVMQILEKQSGLLGISEVSLDTRDLVKRDDAFSKLALEMFAYRARCYAGAYLAALGEAEAVIFGGGIGENTPAIRKTVSDGLRNMGLTLDDEVHDRTTSGDARISTSQSPLAAWVIHVEEGLQLAHECVLAQQNQRRS